MKSTEPAAPSTDMSVASDSVLATVDLVVRYGAVVALHGVSIHVAKGEMVALIVLTVQANPLC